MKPIAKRRKKVKTNGAFAIEKNIRIPSAGGARGKGYSAALRKLQKGESVLLPVKLTRHATSLAYQIFGSGRTVARAVEGGVRVWRIK